MTSLHARKRLTGHEEEIWKTIQKLRAQEASVLADIAQAPRPMTREGAELVETFLGVAARYEAMAKRLEAQLLRDGWRPPA